MTDAQELTNSITLSQPTKESYYLWNTCRAVTLCDQLYTNYPSTIEFWVPAGRYQVKSLVEKCLICKKVSGFPYRAPTDRSQASPHLRSRRRSQQILRAGIQQEMKIFRRRYPRNGFNEQPLLKQLEHVVVLWIGTKNCNRALKYLHAPEGYLNLIDIILLFFARLRAGFIKLNIYEVTQTLLCQAQTGSTLCNNMQHCWTKLIAFLYGI